MAQKRDPTSFSLILDGFEGIAKLSSMTGWWRLYDKYQIDAVYASVKCLSWYFSTFASSNFWTQKRGPSPFSLISAGFEGIAKLSSEIRTNPSIRATLVN